MADTGPSAHDALHSTPGGVPACRRRGSRRLPLQGWEAPLELLEGLGGAAPPLGPNALRFDPRPIRAERSAGVAEAPPARRDLPRRRRSEERRSGPAGDTGRPGAAARL